MHPRAVKIAAEKPAIPLWVRSIFSENPGTLIVTGRAAAGEADTRLLGVTVLANQTLLQIAATEATKVLSMPMFSNAELQVQPLEEAPNLGATICFSLPSCRFEQTAALLGKQGIPYRAQTAMSRVSLVGRHLLSDQAWEAAFVAKVKHSSCSALPLRSSEQVLSVWVSEAAAPALASAIHELLV